MPEGTNTKYYELEAQVIARVEAMDELELRTRLISFIQRSMSCDEVRELAEHLSVTVT